MSLIKLSASDSSTNTIQMNPSLAKKIGLPVPVEVALSYGLQKEKAVVSCSKKIPGDSIILGKQMADRLRMDLTKMYNYRFNGNCLVIGPVIGMLYSEKDAKLTEDFAKFPERYVPYAKIGEQIGGLLFFAAADQIDYKKGKINGHIYDFTQKAWQKKALPFPAIMYRKIKMIPELKKVMGDRILNPACYYKWKFFTLLKDHPVFGNHLPDTTNVINIKVLDSFLQKYGRVFLKRINSGGGFGMALIWKEGRRYRVKVNFNEKIFSYTPGRMKKYLEARTEKHIIQQAIKVKTYDNRKADYRVIAVKNPAGEWEVDPLLGQLGVRGGITIHNSTELYGKRAEELLKLQFNYTPQEIENKIMEMKAFAKDLAKELERKCGACVDFGFDFGLDENGKIYIFEGNTLQELNTPLYLNEHEMYARLLGKILATLKETAMAG